MFVLCNSTVPDIRAPDVIVNEDEGTAELCVSIGNVIEREFILNYTTGEVSNGADGMCVQYMQICTVFLHASFFVV